MLAALHKEGVNPPRHEIHAGAAAPRDNPLVSTDLRHWDNYGVAVDDFGDSPRGDVARFRRTFESRNRRATKSRRSTKEQYLASRGLADVSRPTTMIYYDGKGQCIPTDSLGYPLRPGSVPGSIKGTAGYDTPYYILHIMPIIISWQSMSERRFRQFTYNGTRAASPAGAEQLSGPRAAQSIVRPLWQRAI